MAIPRTPRGRARVVNERLGKTFPGNASELCALRHDNTFQLLVATILSAQCTDERVNIVMPEMIRRFPTPALLAEAPLREVEQVIHSTGFYHAKAEHLLGMATALQKRFAGEVPESLADLVTLPGVGRKTGNVIRSVAFGAPGLPVDTHVGRLSRRLGLTQEVDPVKVESELCALLPRTQWGGFSLRLILHGRTVCLSRTPHCERCELADLCPSAPRAVRPTQGRAVGSQSGLEGSTGVA